MMTHSRAGHLLLGAIALTPFSLIAATDTTDSSRTKAVQSTNVYWGDTHVHTSNSFDAGRNTILVGPEEAYRFARGEQIRSDWGTTVRLKRPLDFLVVADHAQNMGLWNGLRAADPVLLNDESGRAWYNQFKGTSKQGSGGKIGAKAASPGFGSKLKSSDFMRSVWERNCAIADSLNQPGKFTALIGYEWTPQPQGNNLHRVVIYGDDADKAGQLLPFSASDSVDPEDLWKYMAGYEKKTGGRILAIPHNANLSNGLMFATQTYSGNPLTAEYAASRARWEPLIEITQLKGTAEAHPTLSPNDEFADYRIYDQGNMGVKQQAKSAGAKQDWMLPHEYARSALKLGLDLQAKLGVNPFKFGITGGTDGHTGLYTVWNDSPISKALVVESERAPGFSKRKPSRVGQTIWEQVAGGLAAVWAPDNTRTGLFEAMARKETFATTGPRIAVRFYGGWDCVAQDASSLDLAAIGYAKGVPMGGDLTQAPDGKSPGFLIQAVKDAQGANLDRIQVIKGWRDNKGALHEKIYNVALSDGRFEDSAGRVKPVGNSVNVEESKYTNSIGDAELSVLWTDPDFDANKHAFYYARVLEIPTPRWTDFDSLGVDASAGFPMSIVERAYTSPIWYAP